MKTMQFPLHNFVYAVLNFTDSEKICPGWLFQCSLNRDRKPI